MALTPPDVDLEDGPRLNSTEQAAVDTVAVIANVDQLQGLDGLLRYSELQSRATWNLLPASQLMAAREWRDALYLPLLAARDSAATIRNSKESPEDKATAWTYLAEFAKDIRIKPGPPPSIVKTTEPSILKEVEPFTEADAVEVMVVELLSGRLDRIDRASPYSALRGNVQIEAHRYYVDVINERRETTAVNVPLDDVAESARSTPSLSEAIIRIDLERGLTHWRQKGMPRDAAILLLRRFGAGRATDRAIAQELDWNDRRLETAQAALREERWGGHLRRWFRLGGYLPGDHRRRRKDLLESRKKGVGRTP
jgi:hypothetical protein